MQASQAQNMPLRDHIGTIAFYGAMYTIAFSAGFAKGYYNGKGIEMPPLVEPALTYGPVPTAALVGYGREMVIADKQMRPEGNEFAQLLAAGCRSAAGTAAGGIGALVFQGVGYGLGRVVEQWDMFKDMIN